MRQHLTTSKLSKAAGVLFMAALSVYIEQASPANPQTPAIPEAPANPGTLATAQVPVKPAAATPAKRQAAVAAAEPQMMFAAPAIPAAEPVVAAPAAPAPQADPAIPTSNSPLLDNPAAPTTKPAFSVSDAAAPTTEPSTATAEPVDVPADKPANPVSPTDVNVSADSGTVEIHVNDASLVEVLKMISMQSQKNIVASKEVHGTITANLYDVTIPEALDALLTANGYAYKEKGNFIYVYTKKELVEMERAERRQKTEAFRLFYTPAANVVPLVKPALSIDPPGQISFTTAALSGLDSGTKDTGGLVHATEDMIVVTDFPENLDAVRKIIQAADQRPQQILIEATILRAALNEDNALGVDFNVLAGASFNNVLSNTGGQITGANSQADPSKFPADSSHFGGVGTGNNFTNSVSGGLKLGFISDNVSVFLAALEGITDTSVLANPKVLALNKQKGEVIVGRKDGYITTTVSQTTSTQTVDFLETGTRLVFRPYIGNDGYIRMEIHPEDSTGGLNASNLPFKLTTEVTSNIMVKDGHTIVIGGLFRESTTANRSQVPGLGNLPGAGYLFRNQHDTTDREEIIVLLTPHIIKDDDKYSQDSLEQLKDADRIRVGIRQGLMPFGRERLAESCYECAVAEWNKPHPDRSKVLWHLNCALNLNPKYLEAIKMKEKVTGQEVRESDNSSIRDFVLREARADRGMPVMHTPGSVDATPKSHDEPTTRPTASVARPAKSDRPAPAPTTAPSVAEAPKPGILSNLFAWLTTPAGTAPKSEEPAVVVTPAAVAAAGPAPAAEQPAPVEPVIPVAVEPVIPVAAPAAPATQPATTVTDLSLEELPEK